MRLYDRGGGKGLRGGRGRAWFAFEGDAVNTDVAIRNRGFRGQRVHHPRCTTALAVGDGIRTSFRTLGSVSACLAGVCSCIVVIGELHGCIVLDREMNLVHRERLGAFCSGE